jgi:hypothetical protein
MSERAQLIRCAEKHVASVPEASREAGVARRKPLILYSGFIATGLCEMMFLAAIFVHKLNAIVAVSGGNKMLLIP